MFTILGDSQNVGHGPWNVEFLNAFSLNHDKIKEIPTQGLGLGHLQIQTKQIISKILFTGW